MMVAGLIVFAGELIISPPLWLHLMIALCILLSGIAGAAFARALGSPSRSEFASVRAPLFGLDHCGGQRRQFLALRCQHLRQFRRI
jgi:hypothetical protein